MQTELDYVKRELQRLGHAGWDEVRRGSRVPIRTIKRIAYNETEDPSAKTIGKLAIYLRRREARLKSARTEEAEPVGRASPIQRPGLQGAR